MDIADVHNYNLNKTNNTEVTEQQLITSQYMQLQ